MKINFLATALLATIAAPAVVSANELRESKCPDGQIPCDISSDSDCRAQRDRSSAACATTWSQGCCTRECWPDREGNGRICKIAPPSEDYFGLFGLVDIERYDEDSEEFDYISEDPDRYSGQCRWTDPDMDAYDDEIMKQCCSYEFNGCVNGIKSAAVSNCDHQYYQCMNQERPGLAQVA